MAPIGNKPAHKGKAVLAGGLSGAIEICCTYPTEYTKTTQQLSSTPLTVQQVIKNTMGERGVGGFYRGLSSMLYFAAPKVRTRRSVVLPLACAFAFPPPKIVAGPLIVATVAIAGRHPLRLLRVLLGAALGRQGRGQVRAGPGQGLPRGPRRRHHGGHLRHGAHTI